MSYQYEQQIAAQQYNRVEGAEQVIIPQVNPYAQTIQQESAAPLKPASPQISAKDAGRAPATSSPSIGKLQNSGERQPEIQRSPLPSQSQNEDVRQPQIENDRSGGIERQSFSPKQEDVRLKEEKPATAPVDEKVKEEEHSDSDMDETTNDEVHKRGITLSGSLANSGHISSDVGVVD